MITKIMTSVANSPTATVYFGYSLDGDDANQEWGFDLEENSNYTSGISNISPTDGMVIAASDIVPIPFRDLIPSVADDLGGNTLVAGDFAFEWVAFPKANPIFPEFNKYSVSFGSGGTSFVDLSDNMYIYEPPTSDFGGVQYILYKLIGTTNLYPPPDWVGRGMVNCLFKYQT